MDGVLALTQGGQHAGSDVVALVRGMQHAGAHVIVVQRGKCTEADGDGRGRLALVGVSTT